MPTTMHRSSSSQYSAQQQGSDFKVITPLYKTYDKPNVELTTGSVTDLSRKYAETNGDYKASNQQESFRMKIIDPKVDSNAYIPAHGQSQFPRHKSLIDDFPSQHNKRSMLNLDAMEQRKIRSVETRPITSNAYLSESVDRHRAMEASKLREHLKTNEFDANKPWNKPAWPEANHQQNEESLRELEQIRKSIETLQKAIGLTILCVDKLEMDQNHYSNILPDPGFLVRLRTQKYLEQLAKDRHFLKTQPQNGIRRIQLAERHYEQPNGRLTDSPVQQSNKNSLNHSPQYSNFTDDFFEEEYYQKVVEEPQFWRKIEEVHVEQRMPQVSPGPQKSILKNPMIPPPPPLPPSNLPIKNQPTIRLKTRAGGSPIRQRITSNHEIALQKTPTTSFNGPFFRLEQVSPSPSSRPPTQPSQPSHYGQQPSDYPNTATNLAPSRNEFSPNYEYRPSYGTSSETVVIWPPPSSSQPDRQRPVSVTPKSITDPERQNIYERQRQQEMEAMRRREEKEIQSQEKQYYATQLQQQRIQSRMGSHQFEMETQHEQLNHQQKVPEMMMSPASTNLPPMNRQTPINRQTPLLGSDPGPTPNLRVYEARPISAFSDGFALAPSWKQTYLIDEHQEIAARNEILTSDEILEREQFEVDLLQRREAFIEKPEQGPSINRLGRRWQPPPEKPYIWPHTVGDETVEHKWHPIVENPDYKYERKNFTPTNSPPHSPHLGRGTRPLDEVAQRQTRNLIRPSPDGSHRPKPAFKVSRSAPSGGFVPHAPNAVKLVKKRAVDIQGDPTSSTVNQQERDLEMIHETNYHLVNDPSRQRRNSYTDKVNDWEKIYDLPAHASTITDRKIPPNVDVQRRLQLFEKYAKRRSHSVHNSYQSHNQRSPLHVSTGSPDTQKPTTSNGGNLLKKASSSSKPVARVRQSVDQNHLHPNYTPPERASSSRSMHSVRRIIQATQPSPPPASYETARKYVVPALPPGYRLSRDSQRRSPPPQQPGNTRRLMQAVQTAASSHQHNRPLSATFHPGNQSSRHSRSSHHQSSPSTHKYL